MDQREWQCVARTEDSMSVRLSLVTALAALVAASSSAGAQVLSEKNISIKMALVIAETALTQCTPRVSVAVLDRAGRHREGPGSVEVNSFEPQGGRRLWI